MRWILDNQDNSIYSGTVLFEPLLEQPIPTSSTSFGGLKALYGGGDK